MDTGCFPALAHFEPLHRPEIDQHPQAAFRGEPGYFANTIRVREAQSRFWLISGSTSAAGRTCVAGEWLANLAPDGPDRLGF